MSGKCTKSESESSESEMYLFDPHKKCIQSNNEKISDQGTPIKTSLVANIRAIADLSAWVKDSLSKPKCPLYTIYISPKHLTALTGHASLRKLNDMGVSATLIKAMWPIFKPNNFQVILPNQSLSDTITQTLGVPQGQCLSPHLYTLYTANMPAIVKGGDDYLQCLVYADDLAICSNNLSAIQQSIDRLYKYCSSVLPRLLLQGAAPCPLFVTPCPFEKAEMTPSPFD